MPERQEHAIELQWEIAAPPPSAARGFIPYGHAVDLLVKIAVSDSRFAADARTVFEEWRNGLATPEQIPNHELEVGGGAVVSEADDGPGLGTWHGAIWRRSIRRAELSRR